MVESKNLISLITIKMFLNTSIEDRISINQLTIKFTSLNWVKDVDVKMYY